MYGQFNGCHSWGGAREARLETRSPRPRVGSAHVHGCWIPGIFWIPWRLQAKPYGQIRLLAGARPASLPHADAGVLGYSARYCCTLSLDLHARSQASGKRPDTREAVVLLVRAFWGVWVTAVTQALNSTRGFSRACFLAGSPPWDASAKFH